MVETKEKSREKMRHVFLCMRRRRLSSVSILGMKD